MNSKGFSLLEVVFVLIILSILITLNIQNLFVGKDDVLYAKLKGSFASIQNGISVLKTKYALSGKSFDLENLDNAQVNMENEKLFYFDNDQLNVLTNPILSKNSKGYWMKIGDNTYKFKLDDNLDIIFKYENYKFNCYDYNSDKALEICESLNR